MAVISSTILNRVVAVSQENRGISYSDDNGVSWLDSNLIEGSFQKPVYSKSGVAVAISKDGSSLEGIVYSEDGGATWVQPTNLTSGIPESIVKLNNGLLMITLGNSVYISLDGKDWDLSDILMDSYLISKFRGDDYKLDSYNYTVASQGDSGRDLLSVLGYNNISSLSSELHDRSEARDYSGLQIGDYMDFPSFVFDGVTYNNDPAFQMLRVVICGFGVYDGVGNTDSGPGILFQFKRVLINKRMEDSNIDTNNFSATELGGKFNAAIAGLENTLGVSLRTVRRYYDDAWNAEKLFLPTEVEVFGSNHWSANEVGKYSTSIIWPIFSRYPNVRVKFDGGNTQNLYGANDYFGYPGTANNYRRKRWWWTCTKSSTSGYYTIVHLYGGASYNSASHANGGVAPAFYI